MYFFWAAAVLCANPSESVDTIVVCPRSFIVALGPWIDHRRAQGHRLAFVSNESSSGDIRAEIRKAAQSGGLRYALLVGDAEPAAGHDPQVRARSTPVHHIEAKVNIHWGSEPEIATDNWYADLDDDQTPDIAIGRISADSPEELSKVVRKILDYENSDDYGTWRRQINLVAGIGGFGGLVDTILEMATKKFLTDGIPASYNTTMTYGSWQSPFCPDPRLFHDVTLGRLNEGCLFWVYIGHGHRRHLDHVHVPGGAFPIFDSDGARELRSARGSPIALLLACYTGAFDQPSDCLAEEMLRAPGGPAAVICGSRVTMPYGMAVMSDAMMDELFCQKRSTVGEVVLHAKRRMMSADQLDGNRQMLDAIAGAISPAGDQLREELIEHLSLFNLLGDPLLRIRHPAEMDLQAAPSVTAGQRLEVTGNCRIDGRGVIELVCRRDRTKTPLPLRGRFVPTHEFLRSFQEAYRQANDRCWIWQTFTADDGEFQTELTVPADARGPCHVRAFVAGPSDFTMGASSVFVRRPRTESVAAEDGNLRR